jgi:hypothetical protein
MRKFSSYGPIDRELHYYVPRQALIDKTIQQLKGDNPSKGGYYLTVWAPRQTGKTWIMQEAASVLRQDPQFNVVLLSLQFLNEVTDINRIAQFIARELIKTLSLAKLTIDSIEDWHRLIALIGVCAVLGVENVKGSPFNIQRSVSIPNLLHDEVIHLFNQHQQETGQAIAPEVVERIWYEFKGQPGLTNWFGELLTETYNQATAQPITMPHFDGVYAAALDLLPNNNILNIISKAKPESYKAFILKLFQTKTKLKFTYDDPLVNFLYLNGVVAVEQISLSENYVKFPCPYVQKRLFNYFSRERFHEMDGLYEPFSVSPRSG